MVEVSEKTSSEIQRMTFVNIGISSKSFQTFKRQAMNAEAEIVFTYMYVSVVVYTSVSRMAVTTESAVIVLTMALGEARVGCQSYLGV